MSSAYRTVCVSAAIIAVGLLVLWEGPPSPRPGGESQAAESGVVPAVVGKSAAEAKTLVESAGLKPKFVVGTAAPTPRQAFHTYAQDPKAGARLAGGAEVQITIHDQPAEIAAAPYGQGATRELTAVVSSLPMAEPEPRIDPFFGKLFLSAADLKVPAGAVRLELVRTYRDRAGAPGLLGACWRLNWEARVVVATDSAMVEDGEDEDQVHFFWNANRQQYVSPLGDRLVIEGKTRASRWRLDGTKDVFDERGRLIERDLRNGNCVSLRYDAQGRLSRMEGPYQSYLDFRLDGNGRLVEVGSSQGTRVRYLYGATEVSEEAAKEGFAVRYGYHPSGLLAWIDYPQSGKVELTYDVQGRATRRRWADGAEERYAYAEPGSQTTVTDAAGKVTTTQWSVDRRRMEVTDPFGGKSRMDFDASGRPVQIVGPTGLTARIGYDAAGRLASVDDPVNGTAQIEYPARGLQPTAVMRSRGGSQTFQYDAQQNVVSVTGAQGPCRSSTLEYYPDGLVKTLTTCQGQSYQFTYDQRGRLRSVTDGAKGVTGLEYDAQGNLVRETDPSGGVTTRTYDSRGLLASVTDPAGGKTQYEYSPTGLLSKETDPSGAVTGYEYDPRGRLAAIRDAADRVTRFEYDPCGRLKAIVEPDGARTQLEYDAAGNLVREVNPLGGVVTKAYDALGRLQEERDPSGVTASYEYGPAGELLKQIDAGGLVTEFSYDAEGRLVAGKDSAGQTVQLQYDRSGNLTQITAPDGQFTSLEFDELGRVTSQTSREGSVQYEYDALGRCTKEKYAAGTEVSYRYDAMGNLLGWSDNLGCGETIAYDAAGRPEAVTDAGGATTRYGYDPAGRVVQVTDPLGQVQRRAYTPTGQLAQVLTPAGDQARCEYDAGGRLAKILHPAGGQTQYLYDGQGNPTQVTRPGAQPEKSVYDGAGRLLSTTDAKGQTTTFTYDTADRLVLKRLADTRAISYQYDLAGRLTSVDDGTFPVHYTYDASGRMTRIAYPAIQRTLSYEYDGQGRRTRMTDSEGRQINYQYDAFGRVSAIQLGAAAPIALGYDANGRRTSVSYPNGAKGTWQYDSEDRVVKVAYLDAAGKTLAAWTYAYDAAGNRTQAVDAEGRTTQYRYDPSGQLIEEQSPDGKKTTYGYLPGGNRGTRTTEGQTTQYQYDQADRLLQAGQEKFAYDANGNLVERQGPKGTTRYTYDSEDRLVKVVLPDGEEVGYGYAPTGERIWRRDAKGLTHFVTDGVNLLAELGEDLKPKATYAHGPGIDDPLVMLRGGESYCFHTDALGSVVRVTDQDSAVAAVCQYDAFGRIQASQGNFSSPFGFTAREFDAATGLSFHRARYYDPDLGRFLARDLVAPRIEDVSSFNPYVYVSNRPLFYVDPSGAQKIRINLLDRYPPQQLPLGLDPDTTLRHYTSADVRDAALSGRRTMEWGPSGRTLHVTEYAPGRGPPGGIGTPRSDVASIGVKAGDLAKAGHVIAPNPNPNYEAGKNWLIERQPGQEEIRWPRTARGGAGYTSRVGRALHRPGGGGGRGPRSGGFIPLPNLPPNLFGAVANAARNTANLAGGVMLGTSALACLMEKDKTVLDCALETGLGLVVGAVLVKAAVVAPVAGGILLGGATLYGLVQTGKRLGRAMGDYEVADRGEPPELPIPPRYLPEEVPRPGGSQPATPSTAGTPVLVPIPDPSMDRPLPGGGPTTTPDVPSAPPKVPVPPLIGKSQEAARTAVTAVGLVPQGGEGSERPKTAADAGKVYRQSPGAGTLLEVGKPVVYVFHGSMEKAVTPSVPPKATTAKVPVPPLIGEPQEKAVTPFVPPQRAAAADEVPNLIGDTLRGAIAELGAKRLSLGTWAFDRIPANPAEADRVYAQSPAPYTKIAQLRSKAVNLQLYASYGAPQQKPPAPKTIPAAARGFQPGDAARYVDPRFAGDGEKIFSQPGRVQQLHFFTGTGNNLNFDAYAFESREDAAGAWEAMRTTLQLMSPTSPAMADPLTVKTVKANRFTATDIEIDYTSDHQTNDVFDTSMYLHAILYRDRFIIRYDENRQGIHPSLNEKWPAVSKNAKKLIDMRFPK